MHTVKMNEVTFKTHYKLQHGNFQHQNATILHTKEIVLRFPRLSGSIQGVICGFYLFRLRLLSSLLLFPPVF